MDDQPNKEGSKVKIWTFLRIKLLSFFRNITVEPVIFCYMIPLSFVGIALYNFLLEKACRADKNFGEDFCINLIKRTIGNDTITQTKEKEVQNLVVSMSKWTKPLELTLPSILLLFLAAWSDKTRKRKPYILVPLLGPAISALGLILCTYYFEEWSLNVTGVFNSVPTVFTGGPTLLITAGLSYIADHTTEENRTFRIGFINVVITLIAPIGSALSGVVLTLGYYGIFTILIVFNIFGIIYGMYRVKDKPYTDGREEIKFKLTEFISWKPIKENVMVIFKRRKLHRRMRIILLILTYILMTGPEIGTGGLVYNVQRLKHNYDGAQAGYYASYVNIMNFVGLIIGMFILSKLLKLNDTLIGIIACISKVLGDVVFASAPDEKWMYLAPAVEVFGGMAVIAIRSMATKIVDNDEIGKIIGLLCLCDGIMSSIYTPLFASFYTETSGTLPTASFYLSAVLISPAVIIFIFLHILKRKDDEFEKQEIEKHPVENPAFENEITTL